MSKVEEINEFFIHDMNIKKAMSDMTPNPYYLLDEGYITTYFDTAYHDLEYIFDEYREIMKIIYDPYIKDYIEKFFKQLMDEFIVCGYDGFKLNDFYTNRISDMRPKFLTQTNQCTSGFYLMRDASFPIREAKSINELLHVMHSFIVNNDNLYRSNEEVAKAVLSDDMTVTMYGDDNEFGRKIFNIISAELIKDADDILVLSLSNDKALVMTRGLGHATSIEFDRTDKGDIRVAYFIPKICNVDMVNSLKGINPIKPLTPVFAGARGRFYTPEESLDNDLSTLLKGIPSDADLIKDETRTMRV